jgi:hypothetical protein
VPGSGWPKRSDMGEQDETRHMEEEAQEIAPVRKQKKLARPIHDILEGDFLSRQAVIRNVPFLLFLAVVALIYIANTYYAEKTFKEIERTKNELKELRYQYITTRSTLMFESTQVEIARRAVKLGMKETLIPPYKIYYSPQMLDSTVKIP